MTETVWSAEPELFTLYPIIENVCQLLIYIHVPMCLVLLYVRVTVCVFVFA